MTARLRRAVPGRGGQWGRIASVHARCLTLIALVVLVAVAACGTGPTPSTTPTPTIPLDHLTLYAAGTDGTLTAYAAATGKPRWQFKANGAIVAPPSEDDGTLYLGANDGYVYALRTTDGSVRWRTSVGAMVVSTPAVLDSVVTASTVQGTLFALDATSGKELWHSMPVSDPQAGFCIPARPNVGAKAIYYGTSCGVVFALRPQDGHILWQRTVGTASTFPLLVGDTLYVGLGMGTSAPGGGMTALRASDGSSLWTSRDTRGGFSRPAVLGNTLYATDDTATAYAFELTTGKVRWSTSVGYTAISPVAADSSGVYSVVAGYLVALDPATGHQRWSKPLAGLEHGGPLAADGLLFTSAGDRYGQTLAAWATTDGSLRWQVNAPGNTALALAVGA